MRNLILVVLVALFFVGTTEAKNKPSKKVEKVTLFDFQSGKVDSVKAYTFKNPKNPQMWGQYTIDSNLSNDLDKYFRTMVQERYGLDITNLCFELYFNFAKNRKIAKSKLGEKFLDKVTIIRSRQYKNTDFELYKKDLYESLNSDLNGASQKEKIEIYFILNVIKFDPNRLKQYFLDVLEMNNMLAYSSFSGTDTKISAIYRDDKYMYFFVGVDFYLKGNSNIKIRIVR